MKMTRLSDIIIHCCVSVDENDMLLI